ncbi:hypothetical protein PSAC2689_270018 [Paraburkholderia sacchari]
MPRIIAKRSEKAFASMTRYIFQDAVRVVQCASNDAWPLMLREASPAVRKSEARNPPGS